VSWVGWLWIDGRWVDVCEGRTLAAASRRLDAEASTRGIRHNLHRGLTGGAAPTWRPSQQPPAAPQSRAALVDDV
jgi:hypothetical protein